MRTIEMTVTVAPDRTLTVRVPPDVSPGEHRIVLVIEDRSDSLTEPQGGRPPLEFPVDDFGPWPDDLSLHRLDLYGERGR